MLTSKPLSARSQTWLRQQEFALKALASKRVKTKQKVVQEVLHWCIELDLLAASSLQQVEFVLDKQLLNRIAETQLQLKQTCFREDLTNTSRLEQGNISDQEHKNLGFSPGHNRVLVRLAQPLTTALNFSAQFLDLNLEQLDLTQFTRLLVVENLDCFYKLENFLIEESFLGAGDKQQLVVYRGDMLYSQGCKALRKLWLATNKPACYFGDFDPAGVRIALNKQQTFQTMLLPRLDYIQTHATAAMLPDEQIKYLANLTEEANLATKFQDYCKTLHELKALRQQRMQGVELVKVGIYKR